jgi:hypothetical protein
MTAKDSSITELKNKTGGRHFCRLPPDLKLAADEPLGFAFAGADEASAPTQAI